MRFNFEHNFESTPFSSPKSVVSWSRGLETQIKPSGSGNKNDPRLTAVRLIQWAVSSYDHPLVNKQMLALRKASLTRKSKIEWSRRSGCGDFKGLTQTPFLLLEKKEDGRRIEGGGGWGKKASTSYLHKYQSLS